MLVTPEYQAQISETHRENPRWGTSGKEYADIVRVLAQKYGPKNILDYGCGKQTLSRALPAYRIIGYDPGVPGLEKPPEPVDMVVCTDVLEHVEPECLDDVLDDLQRVTRKLLFLQVCTVPAIQVLPNGQNAHLIVENCRWWINHLWDRFDLVNCIVEPTNFVALWFARNPKGNGGK